MYFIFLVKGSKLSKENELAGTWPKQDNQQIFIGFIIATTYSKSQSKMNTCLCQRELGHREIMNSRWPNMIFQPNLIYYDIQAKWTLFVLARVLATVSSWTHGGQTWFSTKFNLLWYTSKMNTVCTGTCFGHREFMNSRWPNMIFNQI